MEDKGIFDKWNDFIDALVNGVKDAVHMPLAWSMVLLIVIIFFSLYDLPQDKKRYLIFLLYIFLVGRIVDKYSLLNSFCHEYLQ